MSGKYLSLRRALSLLRGLQRAPSSKEDLADFVRVDFALDAYGNLARKMEQRRMENDLERLRELGINYEVVGRGEEYRFLTFGDFSPLCLTNDELATLAFLAESFQADAPQSDAVQHLLRRVMDLLPKRQQGEIQGRRQRLRMDLRRRSNQEIHPNILAAIERSVGRQLLRFAYHSPGQNDGVPRVHTVEPWGYLFDTTRGHYYLDGYRRQVEGPFGLWKKGQWQRYRPERIDAESIQLLADRLPATPPKRPRYPLEYLLAPEISRRGEITRHFEDMAVQETDADGWVRVTATSNNLFWATRQLLHYGSNCRVIGGEEAKREMERLIRRMAEMYGFVVHSPGSIVQGR